MLLELSLPESSLPDAELSISLAQPPSNSMLLNALPGKFIIRRSANLARHVETRMHTEARYMQVECQQTFGENRQTTATAAFGGCQLLVAQAGVSVEEAQRVYFENDADLVQSIVAFADR